MRPSARTRLAAVLALVAGLVAVAASPQALAAQESGTLSVCSISGSPAISGILAFVLAAPASAGGSLTQTVAVGACTPRVFYPVGTVVTVTEDVPTGDAVTAIRIGGGQSTIGQTVLGAGVATVTVGSGDSVLTVTTRGPRPAARPCVVPNVVGLTLKAARKAVLRAACRVRSVRYVYSTRIPKGGVTSTSPRHGTHLAHNGPVRVVVSRGARP